MHSASISTTSTVSGTGALSPHVGEADETSATSGFLGWSILGLVAGFLAITTFEGALRFYAAKAGVPWVIYAKDVFLISAVALGVAHTFLTDLRNAAFWLVLALIVLGTVAGLVILPDPRQPLFAAKTWLPLLCGTLAGAAINGHFKAFQRICAVLWIAAVAGIIITAFWPAPWVGFVYEIGGVEVEGSREWAIGGSVRSAGFSRASFDAAMQCVFFGSIAASSRRLGLGTCIWLISAAAVVLAVSRTAMIALCVAAALYYVTRSILAVQRLSKPAILFLAAAIIALPFGAARYYKDVAGAADMTTIVSTSSFEERALKTWPDGLALVSRGGNVITGRGFGGIGVAQQFFEPERFNPGDNLFVYLWGALGASGLMLMLFLTLRAWGAPMPLSPKRQIAMVVVGAFLAIGLTLNGIEAAVASLFLGFGLVWLTDPSFEE